MLINDKLIIDIYNNYTLSAKETFIIDIINNLTYTINSLFYALYQQLMK